MTMTEPTASTEHGDLLAGLAKMRDELREMPPTSFSSTDVAAWLDELLGDSEGDPLLASTVRALQDGLDGAGFVGDALEAIAMVALAHIRPRLTARVLADVADVIREFELRCPVHDSDDCSPASNGCDVPVMTVAAIAHYVQMLSVSSDADDIPNEGGEE